jgi:hypothetical protein
MAEHLKKFREGKYNYSKLKTVDIDTQKNARYRPSRTQAFATR